MSMIGEIKKVKVNSIKYDKDAPVVDDQVDGLISSIRDNGLLHPITVTADMLLIAGRHRLAAYIKAGWDEIPALVTPGNLTPDEVLEIHIHENIRRHNMPWYEQVVMEKSLHELRQRQLGKAEVGRPHKTGRTGWSLRDTAKELTISLGSASESLQLAVALERDPTLRKIEDRTTALKLIRESAKRTEQTFLSGLYPGAKDEIFLGDATEVLKKLDAESFDACITDPPWLVYKDKALTADERTIGVFDALFRVLRNNSFLFAFVGTKDFYYYQQELPKFGYTVQDFPLIWAKENVFSHGVRSWEFGRNHELILLAVKGSPALTDHHQKNSVLTYPVVPPVKLKHPNEKPEGLMEILIKDCTFDSGSVIDPFAGSGAVLSAAKKLNRHFIGIEREKNYYDVIVKRLA